MQPFYLKLYKTIQDCSTCIRDIFDLILAQESQILILKPLSDWTVWGRDRGNHKNVKKGGIKANKVKRKNNPINMSLYQNFRYIKKKLFIKLTKSTIRK